jgi:hypothetical protein
MEILPKIFFTKPGSKFYENPYYKEVSINILTFMQKIN